MAVRFGSKSESHSYIFCLLYRTKSSNPYGNQNIGSEEKFISKEDTEDTLCIISAHDADMYIYKVCTICHVL